jgi:hypothetical protein
MTICIDMTEDQLRDLTQPLTPAHITELCELRASAKAAAEMFTTAIAEQAEKSSLGKGALRRYICAREADKLEGLADERDDVETLLEMNL